MGPENFADFADLFGPRGGGHSCWCMTWRLPNSVYAKNDNEANRDAFEALVVDGRTTGILGYRDEQAVGWCSVSPRPGMQRVVRSSALGLDDVENPTIWSVVCFYIRGGHRKQGLQAQMLDAAVAYARDSGAHRLEAYPMTPRTGNVGDVYTGTLAMYERAGFIEAGRATTGRRVVMSYALTRALAEVLS